MADALFKIGFVVPAGNGVQTIGTLNFNIGPSVIRRIILDFPAGCMGNVGIAVTAGKSPAFPNNPNAFIVFDGYQFDTEVSNQIDSGQWGLMGYNTDFVDHQVRSYFFYDYVRQPVSSIGSQLVAL